MRKLLYTSLSAGLLVAKHVKGARFGAIDGWFSTLRANDSQNVGIGPFPFTSISPRDSTEYSRSESIMLMLVVAPDTRSSAHVASTPSASANACDVCKRPTTPRDIILLAVFI